MDLSNYSVADLKDLFDKLPREIARREKDEKLRIRKELEAMAAKAGYSLDDLLNEAPAKTKTSRSVAAKYRSPANPELSWTGRGRQPRWVVDFIAQGGKIEELAI